MGIDVDATILHQQVCESVHLFSEAQTRAAVIKPPGSLETRVRLWVCQPRRFLRHRASACPSAAIQDGEVPFA